MGWSTRVCVIAAIFAVPGLSHAQNWYTNGWLYTARIPVTVRNPASQERPDEPVHGAPTLSAEAKVGEAKLSWIPSDENQNIKIPSLGLSISLQQLRDG